MTYEEYIVAMTPSSKVAAYEQSLDREAGVHFNRVQELEYKTETRELDGVTYDVEIFPETINFAEAAFYFDENGKLVHVELGVSPWESEKALGKQNYKINAIDNAVDDSSFDVLSGYKIYDSFDEYLNSSIN